MKGNRSNHPPRAGVAIKPSKGGRTKRYTFVMTPETWERLQMIVKEQGVSFNDWLDAQIKK